MNKVRQHLINTGCFYDCEALENYISLIHKNIETPHMKFKTQQHHIVPRCYFEYNSLACDDSNSNTVNLLFKDHLMAHYYLFHCCNDGNLRHALASAFLLLKNTTCKDITIEDVDIDDLQKMFEEYLRTRSILYKGRTGYNKGRRIINNGVNEKLVFPEELNEFLQDGWTLGRLPFSEEDLNKKSQAHKNRRVMNNGIKTVHVKPQDIQEYLDQGFVFGHTQDFKETMKRVAAENATPKGTYTTVFDGNNYKRIKTSELDSYIDTGYIKKGPSISEEQKKTIGEKNKLRNAGRIHVHNDTEHYMVKPEEVESYVAKGFIIGSGISNVQPPSVWMNKDGKNARVHPDDEEKFVLDGWTRGMLKGSKLKK